METILVVDDSLTARSILKKCIKIIGLHDVAILEAENGAAALRIMDKHEVDLVFTDLNMPEMGGEQFLRRLKSRPELADIPVVVIASAGNKAKEIELLQQGAAALVSKPLAPLRLRMAMEKANLFRADLIEGCFA